MGETHRRLDSPLSVEIETDRLDELLSQEWLLTNRLGSYASSTVVGCNTRRYHALLVAATAPPVKRVTSLSTVMETLTGGDGQAHALATNEFDGSFSPDGFERLKRYIHDVVPTFIYGVGNLELTKQIVLAEQENTVCVRYRLRGGSAKLTLRPFAAIRDFHHLRQREGSSLGFVRSDAGGIAIEEGGNPLGRLSIHAGIASFTPESVWWFQFRYRADAARGQDCHEDLFCPGAFELDLADGQSVQLVASFGEDAATGRFDFDAAVDARRRRQTDLISALPEQADEFTRRLAVASDDFVVRRQFVAAPPSTTIVAGYHWFADWGRDAFISLPGLLLSTGRFAQARQTFLTFIRHMSEGMVPNRFDDYVDRAHYNAIDASLWFVIAADRYVEASGDKEFWHQSLEPAVLAVLRAYRTGTRFGIHANADGLITGGTAKTQLTWMDAALGDEVITTRHGLAVEVNALWYAAHCCLARRTEATDPALAGTARDQAEQIAEAFNRLFWNATAGCLFDCINEAGPDASIRPNQILAVSLPDSPLPRERQRAVVEVVRGKLLTPFGLRTLDTQDRVYCGRYDGSWTDRDRAYHQGTAWGWLLGPFIEAYLRVNEFSAAAASQAEEWLGEASPHLHQAGLGTVSEIFDGDWPHTPRGCIAQAWSVAEWLRVKTMLAGMKKRPRR